MVPFNQRLTFGRVESDELYKLALEAYRKRNLDEAILKMNEAIAAAPKRAELYAARGFFYLEDGVRNKALPDFTQAVQLHSLEMLGHYGLGMIAYQDADWDAALGHFMNAFRSAPKRAECMYYLALTHHRRGENTQAAYFMEQSITQFDKGGDKRKGDAQKWLKEFQKLNEQTAAATPPPTLP
jgi:tetratricopeptide (TPR) repeat protein